MIAGPCTLKRVPTQAVHCMGTCFNSQRSKPERVSAEGAAPPFPSSAQADHPRGMWVVHMPLRPHVVVPSPTSFNSGQNGVSLSSSAPGGTGTERLAAQHGARPRCPGPARCPGRSRRKGASGSPRGHSQKEAARSLDVSPGNLPHGY